MVFLRLCSDYSYVLCFSFFFFKQKTAYEMRISDWSSDVCSSDLCAAHEIDAVDLFLADEQGGAMAVFFLRPVGWRSEERRVGKSVSVRVDLGGRRIIKQKTYKEVTVRLKIQ